MPAVEVIGDAAIARFAIISFLLRSRFNTGDPPPPELKPYLLEFPSRDGHIVYYVHHNLVAKLINDIYGIQVRPGCSCAGPYGHWLLSIDDELSAYHRNRIDNGLLDLKPGWIRVTFNELNSLEDVTYVLDAIEELSTAWETYAPDYGQDVATGAFFHREVAPLQIGVRDWMALHDPGAAPSNPAVEWFIRKEILPYAANTHTEVSFTGTVTTRWYHWAQETIKECCGVDDRYVLRFVRAGYEPLRCLLFALGLEIPARLEARYHISKTMPASEWSRIVTLGAPLEGCAIPLLANVVPCESTEELIRAASRDPARTIVLWGFDRRIGITKEATAAARELQDMRVQVIAEITERMQQRPVHMVKEKLTGAVIVPERLPGGLQTHPVLLLREDLFGNRLPMDVGGGIVDWTTERLQRYVSDRTVLEDAGTPGIIQGIRTALIMRLTRVSRNAAPKEP
jgi:selenocysteine lyase/cysteine desulfurase